jgi:hypothetical protein
MPSLGIVPPVEQNRRVRFGRVATVVIHDALQLTQPHPVLTGWLRGISRVQRVALSKEALSGFGVSAQPQNTTVIVAEHTAGFRASQTRY